MSDKVTPTPAEQAVIEKLRARGVEVKDPYVGDDGEVVVVAAFPITESRVCSMMAWGASTSEALESLEEKCVAAAKIAEAFKSARSN